MAISFDGEQYVMSEVPPDCEVAAANCFNVSNGVIIVIYNYDYDKYNGIYTLFQLYEFVMIWML